MTTKELINYCSDINYWTKNQIITAYTESGWFEVQRYRDNLRANYLLSDSVNEKIGFVLTPHLVMLEINLHKNINKLANYFFSYQTLIGKQQKLSTKNHLFDQIKREVFTVVNNGYKLQINEKTINRILLEKQRPGNYGQQLATQYVRFLYSLSGNMLHDKISRNVCGFNSKTTGIPLTEVFRQDIIAKKTVKHYMVINKKTVHYNGFHPVELQQRLGTLDAAFDKISSSALFCTAVLTYYYIKFGLFFKKYNEISAIATMYLVIGHEYPKIVALLNLGKEIFNHYDELQTAITIAAESDNRDITALCYCFLKILNNSLQSQLKKLKMELQNIQSRSNNKHHITPVEINTRARLLCEANRNISIRQGRFFITHQTVGRQYTIGDFRQDSGSSYETSRYSLDNLVNNGFYVKKKYKKKFIFEVVVKQQSINRNDKY